MRDIVLNGKQVRWVLNSFLQRNFGGPILDGRYGTRDIDAECGYPEEIGIEDYVRLYSRNDVAARIVDLEPNECWQEYPEIYETEEERETEFEKAVDELISSTNLYTYLLRSDRISGLGEYGILFLGLDDGESFDKPAPGFTETEAEDSPGDANVVYYRVFDQSSAVVSEYETDQKSPRYQQPKYYTLQFAELGAGNVASKSEKVHWSRVIHLADNLATSEVFGTPRLKNVYNRFLDLRKILGGSAEMFWKGGFPGYSFEVDPAHGEFSPEDKEALKEETKAYAEGLVRYLTTVGVSAKSLAPQVADPTPHTLNILRVIAITKGIPLPLLLGHETGALSGTTQAATWAERIAFRRNMYVSPHIIRPVINRLIQVGALPVPTSVVKKKPGLGVQANFTIKWVPLAKLTEMERAEVAKNLTEALARYSTAGGEALVPLGEFLGKFLGFSFQQVEAILKAAPTNQSVVLQELEAGLAGGNTGSANGNMPTSIPNMAKTKDPSKTPQNTQQRKKGTVVTKKPGKSRPGPVE